MRIKTITAFYFCALFSTNLLAQNENAGTITGSVVDESTGRALEFVNVVLRKGADSSIVTGTVTDKDGRFELDNIAFHEYVLRLSQVGYKEKVTQPFRIEPLRKRANFGVMTLVEMPVSLDEVMVTGQKQMFNIAIDRKVYNVDQDMMSKAGSASEVLQNIPSVEVDMEGNVSLRGSTSVLIMINGKTSALMGKNRGTVLQQLPAGTLEKIEVITNPSAKYKPDGSSGIINIVMKKNIEIGLNGNVAGNLGNQNRYNGSVRLNYNPDDFNLFGSYSLRKDNRNRISSDTRTQMDADSTLSVSSDDVLSFAAPLSHMVSLGTDYVFSQSNSVGLSGNFFYHGVTRTDNSTKVFQNSSKAMFEEYDRNRVNFESEREYEFTSYVQHLFSKEDHKLRIEFTGSYESEVEDNRSTNMYRLPAIAPQFDNTRFDQGNRKTQLSMDYENPLTESSVIEAGYAGEFNNSDLDLFAEFYDANQQRFVADIKKTNRFVFDESIHAVYATLKRSFGGFGFLAGLRAEQAFTNSHLVTMDSNLTNNYFNVYPTLHLSYKFSDAAEMQLNYSRRIHRPEADHLNPFPEYQDDRNLSAGNPSLKPEYTHAVELGCKLENDLLSILPSLYYRYTHNRFTSVTEALNDSVLLTTSRNLANDQSAGFEVVASGNVWDMLTTHLSANVYYNQIDASNLGYGQNKSIVTWSSAITLTMNLTKTSIFQMNSNYRSARLTPQGETLPSYVMNVGMRQELSEGKFSLILTVADVFNTLRRKTELSTPALNQTIINTRDSRILYLGFTYNFGTPAKKREGESLRYDDNL